MLDRLTSMRVFVRVLAAGSLSAAARQLGMSAGMVTKHVDALEAKLGIKLLHRSTRHLSLTEAGSGYLEACQRILAEIDEADAAAASQRITARGVLRMTAPLSFGSRFVAPLLPEFSRRHPEVQVELELSNSRVDLLEGGWDLAIRIGTLPDSLLQARQLGACPTVICAAPAYLARRGTPRLAHELSTHNCLAYSVPSIFGNKHWSLGEDGSLRVPIRGDLLTNNGDVLLAAALGGQGVIYQPRFIVGDALQAGRLVALELDHPTCPLGGIHALYPTDRRPPAKVREMIDYLCDALRGPAIAGASPVQR